MTLAILYLFGCIMLGFWLIEKFLPKFLTTNDESVGQGLIVGPSVFIVGTLTLTTMVYGLAYLFTILQISHALSWANAVAVGGIFGMRMRKMPQLTKSNLAKRWRKVTTSMRRRDFIIIMICLAFSSILMIHSLHGSGEAVLIGRGVYGDMNAHIPLIRSFSMGQNIPTEYPFFAGEGIRYHFMFYFLAGNLEFLGMPLIWALNIPSILSLTALLLLLYALAAIITHSATVGILTLVLFCLRSSYGVVSFFQKEHVTSVADAWRLISHNTRFVGDTLHEGWGIWNLNVYINQRHFSFAIALLLVILIALARERPAATAPDRQESG